MASPPLSSDSATPGLRRRLAAFLYEGVLLFGVLMVAGLIYSPLTQQRHALQGTLGLQVVVVVVVGLYFVWFWTRGGQTLAMKTWHIRLQRADGGPVTWPRATLRYLLCWLWFLPSLAAARLADLKGGWVVFSVTLAGVLAYAATSRLHPQRQFPHDALCGTRLVDAPRSPAR